MNDIRARFEEIWPVPDDIYWDAEFGMYLGGHENRLEWDARLDTFTRCQETTDVYVSLVDELVKEIEECYQVIVEDRGGCFIAECVDRAKQIIGDKK